MKTNIYYVLFSKILLGVLKPRLKMNTKTKKFKDRSSNISYQTGH